MHRSARVLISGVHGASMGNSHKICSQPSQPYPTKLLSLVMVCAGFREAATQLMGLRLRPFPFLSLSFTREGAKPECLYSPQRLPDASEKCSSTICWCCCPFAEPAPFSLSCTCCAPASRMPSALDVGILPECKKRCHPVLLLILRFTLCPETSTRVAGISRWPGIRSYPPI